MKTRSQTIRKDPDHDVIAVRAYEIWEAAGRPSGHDLNHWLQAEAELSTGQVRIAELQPPRSQTQLRAAA